MTLNLKKTNYGKYSQVHKYLDKATMFVILSQYTTTLDMKWSHYDENKGKIYSV